MAKTKKGFDAVRMMRGLRDSLSRRLNGMTFEEQREYIRSRLRGVQERQGDLVKTGTRA